MFILIAKIILIGSIVGMAAMVIVKISALRALPAQEPSKVLIRSCLTIVWQKSKKGAGLSRQALKKNFSSIKHTSQKVFKQKQVKLSSDYWEKVRRGK